MDIILLGEVKKILSENEKYTLDPKTEKLINEVCLYLEQIYANQIDVKELEECYLTSTLVLIWKIDRLLESIKVSKIKEYRIMIDFKKWVSFNEFVEYYNFIWCEDGLQTDMWNTTSLFNNLQQSSTTQWLYLLHQELYEHEDDTDDSLYYIILKSN